MKEQMIALLKKLGIWNDAKADEITKALDEIKIEPSTAAQPANIDTSKVTDPVMKQMFESLNNQITVLTQQNKTLLDTIGQEKTQREAAIQAQQAELKKQKDQKVAELVAKALKEGKIPKAKEGWLKNFAERDLDGATEWEKDAPVDKHLAAEQGKSSDGKNKDGKKKEGEKKDDDGVKSPLSGANPGILSKVHEFAGISEN